MSAHESTQWLTMFISVPLTGFLIYRRFKRTFGRQLIKPKTMWARIALLSGVALLLVITAPTPEMFAAALGGLAIGAAAAMFGFKRTLFDVTTEGRFYTPDKWVGIAMLSLFLGRFVSRLLVLQQAGATSGQSPFAGMQRSALTTGTFWVLASYYVIFYVRVLQRAKQLVNATP